MDYKPFIRQVKNFPKPGITFMDITTLLKRGDIFAHLIGELAERYSSYEIDAVAAIEARGFIFGAPLAMQLNRAFIPIRKQGKLPAETLSTNYSLEYGKNTIQIHKDAVRPGEKVLLIDDLIATGGSLAAAIELLKRLGAKIPEICAVIELVELDGRKKITPTPLYSLIQY